MPDGEELEQFITEQIDQERIKDAILKIEIDNLKKAVKQSEDVVCLQTHKQAKN